MVLWYFCIKLLYIAADPKGVRASISKDMMKKTVLEKGFARLTFLFFL